MKDFKYYAPTEVVFGEQSEEQVAALVKKYGGTKVLVHYGGRSAEKSGLLDKICHLLSQGLCEAGWGCAQPPSVACEERYRDLS